MPISVSVSVSIAMSMPVSVAITVSVPISIAITVSVPISIAVAVSMPVSGMRQGIDEALGRDSVCLCADHSASEVFAFFQRQTISQHLMVGTISKGRIFES